ncbi:MAG: NAD(P)-dependent oxidoreductase [Rhodospirillales bacterium]
MKRFLITGAAGRIGTALRAGLADKDTILRLTDVKPLGEAGPNEELVECDLADLDQFVSLCDGVDAVVHLAGLVHPSLSWEDALHNNFLSNYNSFEAARLKNVKRVVFASSIHAHGFARRNTVISQNTPYRPDGLYGLAKVFGEATGQLYADKYGMEVVCLRIASFRPQPSTVRELATWLSPRDAVQLVRRSIDTPNAHFICVYGTSNNDKGLYDTSNWKTIGYAPVDDSAEFADKVSKDPEPEFDRQFHGAHYTSPDFAGDISKI